jgi:ferredoxin-NADP reductase
MLRHHRAVGSEIPARLLYSARTQGDLIYRTELEEYETTFTLTREHDPGWTGRTGRVDRDLIAELAWPPAERPRVYVCGPTGFVEAVADALVALGHEPARIRTERFGPT